MKCFKCETIKEKDSLILIHFTLKNKSRYSENEDLGIMDMARVKIYFENYLAKNPQSPLNQKNIDISFQTYADDSMHMYNYDYRDNTMKEVLYNKFLFFDELCAENFSVLQIFNEVYSIDILAHNIDSVDFLEEHSNLQYLHIWTPDLTEEKVTKIKNIIPNCELIIR